MNILVEDVTTTHESWTKIIREVQYRSLNKDKQYVINTLYFNSDFVPDVTTFPEKICFLHEKKKETIIYLR